MMNRNQSSFGGIITIYFIIFLHPLLNTFASHTPPLCRRDQRNVLLELKKEFRIPTDDHLVIQWNTSIDCCSWWGVTCDAISGEVVSLDLIIESANVSLKSSTSLFKLQHLRHLKLSHGVLQGEIPSSIGNLSHLTNLDLSGNQLVGEVPASIGNLNQLIEIDLSGNYLRGNIPTSFANFTKLSQLVLNENHFTGGDIFLVLPNLTSLFNINLSFNNFSSTFSVDLSGLHNLGQFVGSHNSFSGPFPSSLLMISSLERIYFSQNHLEGPIDFRNVSSSSQLSELDVGYNNLDGPISESISKLRNLVSLDLSHNHCRGKVLRSISILANLTYLDLSYNKLEGQVPHSLWKMSLLRFLRLSHNPFISFGKSVEVPDEASISYLDLGSTSLEGPFPQWICKLRYLSSLVLSNNHITGFIPQCLESFNYLEDLNLRNNSLSGFIPNINSSEFRSLDVSRNNLVGKLPRTLVNCHNLKFLNVGGNKIKDTFPFWLGSQSYLLTVLVLRSNAFYGPVYNPSAYLGFPYMRIIDISNNNFVGSLPQEYFANWSSMSLEDQIGPVYMNNAGLYEDSVDLVYKGVEMDFTRILPAFMAIDFSGNQFYGHIPKSIGMLSQLRLLNLSGNAFTGIIPPSLANISNLETLDLSRNNLSGEIPQGLRNLSSLSNMNFSHNHLQGLVPRSTQFGSQNCSSFVGNPQLYGLEEICGKNHVSVPPLQQPEESFSEPDEPVLHWIAAAIAFGPGVFCGLVIGHIFTSYKHEWFMPR